MDMQGPGAVPEGLGGTPRRPPVCLMVHCGHRVPLVFPVGLSWPLQVHMACDGSLGTGYPVLCPQDELVGAAVQGSLSGVCVEVPSPTSVRRPGHRGQLPVWDSPTQGPPGTGATSLAPPAHLHPRVPLARSEPLPGVDPRWPRGLAGLSPGSREQSAAPAVGCREGLLIGGSRSQAGQGTGAAGAAGTAGFGSDGARGALEPAHPAAEEGV